MNSVQITKNATPPRGAWRRVAGWAMEGGKVRGLYPPPPLVDNFPRGRGGRGQDGGSGGGAAGHGRDQGSVAGSRPKGPAFDLNAVDSTIPGRPEQAQTRRARLPCHVTVFWQAIVFA